MDGKQWAWIVDSDDGQRTKGSLDEEVVEVAKE